MWEPRYLSRYSDKLQDEQVENRHSILSRGKRFVFSAASRYALKPTQSSV
jgi:hypothetical protein